MLNDEETNFQFLSALAAAVCQLVEMLYTLSLLLPSYRA